MAEKKKMSKGKMVGLGCLGLIVIFIIIGVVASGKSPQSSSNKTQTETKKEFTKDETITLKDHELYITEVKENFDSGNPYSKPEKDDNMFVVVGVKIKNTSGKDLLFNSYGFKLEDEAGIKRDMAYFTGLENRLEAATLAPGAETTGNLGFEAKKDSSKLILYYSGNILSGGEVTVKLK